MFFARIAMRRDESRRGTHECVRHIAGGAVEGLFGEGLAFGFGGEGQGCKPY